MRFPFSGILIAAMAASALVSCKTEPTGENTSAGSTDSPAVADNKADKSTEPSLPNGTLKPAAQDDLIVPGSRVGPVVASTTKGRLDTLFGKNNVLDIRYNLGEGQIAPATVLFPNSPKEITLIWLDTTQKRFPARAILSRADAPYHTQEGVRIGSTLKELEALNGKGFRLFGFGWDGGGLIANWDGGKLTQTLPARKTFWGTLGLPDGKISSADMKAISGEQQRNSAMPVLQKLNPTLVRMGIDFVK